MSSSKHNQEVLDKFIDNNIDEHEEMLADLRRKEDQELEQQAEQDSNEAESHEQHSN